MLHLLAQILLGAILPRLGCGTSAGLGALPARPSSGALHNFKASFNSLKSSAEILSMGTSFAKRTLEADLAEQNWKHTAGKRLLRL